MIFSNKYKSTYTHPPLFVMGNIKLDWIPTKIRRLNNKIPPALLLVLQCLFQVLRRQAALLPKSYKIQLAVLLFLVVLDEMSNPLHLKFLRTPYRKKEKLWYSPVSSVLLTRFGLSVSSVWWPGLIEKLTIMILPCDLQKVGTASQVAGKVNSWL